MNKLTNVGFIRFKWFWPGKAGKTHWKNTKDCPNYSENTNKPFNLTKVMNRFNKTDKITLKTYTPYYSTIKLLIVINSIGMH